MTKRTKIALLLILDITGISLVYITALLLRFEFVVSNPQFQGYLAIFLDSLIGLLAIKIGVFASMGLYSSLWKYASMDELVRIVAASFVANVSAVAFLTIAGHSLPRSVYFIATVLDMAAVGVIRLSYRWARNRYSYQHSGNRVCSGIVDYKK